MIHTNTLKRNIQIHLRGIILQRRNLNTKLVLDTLTHLTHVTHSNRYA